MRLLLLAIFYLTSFLPTSAQVVIKGTVSDAHTGQLLPYVNIGIRDKNLGTISSDSGTFTLSIPAAYNNDSILVSLVGYKELRIQVNSLKALNEVRLKLEPKATDLKEISVHAEAPTETYYGLKNYHPILHFLDGSINTSDIFEIAELLHLGNNTAKIKSLKLHVNEDAKDSATFRINFYDYDGHKPVNRIVEKNIIQKFPVKEGWLNFELSAYNIHLKGDVVAAIEFIPSGKKNSGIAYEIKPGGRTKCFVRSSSFGSWQVPPHQYRMYLTALQCGKHNGEDGQEDDIAPSFRRYSQNVKDSFSIFLRLPHGYYKKKRQSYPVVYVLDANVYFNYLADSIDRTKGQQPILVGIGYKDFPQMDSLRDRDYTFPAADLTDSLYLSGGANRFYQFISEELMPYMDSTYRTDKDGQTLMGHSLGGYFTLYALYKGTMQGKSHFANYVAASPSVDYHKGYILKEFQKLHSPTENAVKTIYITYGTGDNDDSPAINYPQMIDSLVNHLKSNGYTVTEQNYQGAAHMETALPSFYTGLQLILNPKK